MSLTPSRWVAANFPPGRRESVERWIERGRGALCGVVLGILLGVGGVVGALNHWPVPREGRVITFYRADVQPRSTDDLALRLTPHVQQFLGEHRDEFAKRAGGPMERMAVKWGMPVAQREVPVVLEHGLNKLADELSTWSVKDVIRWLDSVADNKGVADGRLARELKATQP